MVLRNKLVVAGVVVAALMVIRFFFSGSTGGRVSQPDMKVRVRLLHDVSGVNISGKGRCEVADTMSGVTLFDDMRLEDGCLITPAPGGMSVNGDRGAGRLVKFLPAAGGMLAVNGTFYRGKVDVVRTKGGLDVVNIVDLEDYLKGVLPREVNHLWPSSALKAQAIASRSFAVYRVLNRSRQSYDLTADTFSQVYGGRSAEKWRTSRAVEDTGGKVLEYRGEVLPAYFHSCCGGHTQDASRIWWKDIKPLRGVKCTGCRWSPYFRWQVRMPARDILKELNAHGYNLGSLDNIKEGPRDSSGRLEYVRVKSGNQWFEITTKDLRKILGTRKLKSANLHIKRYPFFYVFSGYGWGHGVGMCQWGAFGLSLKRWSPERILAYYYPGSDVVYLSEVMPRTDTGEAR